MEALATLGLTAFLVDSIRTPLDTSVVWVEASQSVAEADALLREPGFDQAPVRGAGEGPSGWYLRGTPERAGLVRDHLTGLDECLIVGGSSPLGEVLAEVEKRRFVFTAGPKGVDGFIVLSDLDRHACRAYFYTLISSIEMRLSGWLRHGSGLSNDAIKSHMTSLERNWFKKAEEGEVDLHPAEYLGLATMIKLFSSAAGPELATRELTDDLNAVMEIRNEIMHPTKSLVQTDPKVTLSEVDQAARRCLARFDGADGAAALGAWPSQVR